ncbi:6756_t:CDS:2, partial [Gigaspora rosea]
AGSRLQIDSSALLVNQQYKHIDDSSQSTVKCYLWTGRNEYMILSEHDCLAIGGGDGKVGLWIDADLQRGHSERCDTFDNDILSSSSEFDCIGFEVWG